MVMVKPALPYLDVLRPVRDQTRRAGGGLPRERRVRDDQGRRGAGLARRARRGARGASPPSARAGADMILTYFAARAARLARRTAARRRARPSSSSEAQRLIPGGVNSPGPRVAVASAAAPALPRARRGRHVWDVDGNEYVDCVMSWGPLILGHAHPAVVAAGHATQAGRGTTFGAPTELEVELAGRVVTAVPSVELVRLVSSGTEATMSALRLARGVHRPRQDRQVRRRLPRPRRRRSWRRPAPALATLGDPGQPRRRPRPSSPTRCVAEYNDLAAVRRACPSATATRSPAIIVEPVAGNMGVVPPRAGLPRGAARELRPRTGALLIFDEVITGFRVACGGAQERFGVTPDLTCARQDHRRRPARRRRSAAAATSWSVLAPLGATSTRPARSRGTRSPWPPAWPPCACCASRASTSGSRPPARASLRGRARRAGRHHQPGRRHAHDASPIRARCAASPTPGGRHRRLRRVTGGTCSRAASTSRRRSSRRR